MTDFPSKKALIESLRIAIKRRDNDEQNYREQATAALDALLDALPVCEEPHSAAYCYEKLEAMRVRKK